MAPVPRDRDKLSRMEQAVRVLIHGLGEDLDREGLRDTPKRVAKALLDCTQGYHQDTSSTLGTALFHEPIVHQGGEGVVVVRDIDFASTSEETLLPFHGRCHVAYRPKDGVVLGLSKLARLTKQYAKRLQTQERLAAAVALALQQSLECHGVAVVLHARHLSNSSAPEERTNACVSGVFASKGSAELEELLALLDLEDLPAATITNLDRNPPSCLLAHQHPLPGAAAAASAAASADPGVPAPGTPDPSEKDTDGDSDDLVLEAPCCCEEMEAAVQQLLVELGEEPNRPGLAGASRRYVMSLLASTSGYHMQPPTPQAADHLKQQQQQLEVQQQQREAQRGAGMSGLACAAGGEGGLAAGGVAAAADVCSRPRCCGVAGSTGQGASAGRGACGHHHHAGSSGRGGGCLGATQPAAPAGLTSSLNGLGRSRTATDPAAAAAAGGASGLCAHAASCRSPSQPPPPQQQQQQPLSGRAPEAAGDEVALASGPLRGAVTLRMPFASQCEHHMLPFYGNLMVSYLPGAAEGVGVTRAAVEQVVTMFTQRLQVQERITHQVADAVEAMLLGRRSCDSAPQTVAAAAADASACVAAERCGTAAGSAAGFAAGAEAEAAAAAGVMVVCDAAHMCMVARGVENHSGSTTTFAVRGAFASRPELRRAVLRLFREQQ
ncbi:hypothetical protein PLESTF_001212500 [Pleodorina starrii]|nr:hypothetical protein PLESTM_000312000 [Pleodorina starrii]GLC72151.1 hypothetical protein PLESTF_001212500 [Pleodorina starrii]